MQDRAVVAVFNTSEDTIDLLRMAFEHEGFIVVSAFTNELRDGRLELEAFMRTHRPNVVVYDIALPYDANWRLFEHLRSTPACRDVPFVLTTTNVAHVRKVAGPDPELHEIVGKPYDLDEIMQAARKALSGSA